MCVDDCQVNYASEWLPDQFLLRQGCGSQYCKSSWWSLFALQAYEREQLLRDRLARERTRFRARIDEYERVCKSLSSCLESAKSHIKWVMTSSDEFERVRKIFFPCQESAISHIKEVMTRSDECKMVRKSISPCLDSAKSHLRQRLAVFICVCASLNFFNLRASYRCWKDFPWKMSVWWRMALRWADPTSLGTIAEWSESCTHHMAWILHHSWQIFKNQRFCTAQESQ